MTCNNHRMLYSDPNYRQSELEVSSKRRVHTIGDAPVRAWRPGHPRAAPGPRPPTVTVTVTSGSLFVFVLYGP
jgi:hypothetical protein